MVTATNGSTNGSAATGHGGPATRRTTMGSDWPAAYVLTGESIYTMDPERPRVKAVGVVGERIVATGEVAEVVAALPEQASRIDLGSRMLLPGFTDSHIHFGYVARKWKAIDLGGCGSAAEALERVKQYAENNPDAPWIDGHGWDANEWPDADEVHRHRLDEMMPGRIVALTSKDGHALWVSSATLALAGIDRTTPDPEGGRLARDEGGELTGVLFETARQPVFAALPPPDTEMLAQAIEEATPELHAQGITAIHCPELLDEWKAYQRLLAEGRLHVRVTFMPQIRFMNDDGSLQLAGADGPDNEWLRVAHIKYFADGTLGQRTAAMLEPFVGEPDNVGLSVYDPAELTDLVCKAVGHGYPVAIHAIGDRAVREALDALEAARALEAQGKAGAQSDATIMAGKERNSFLRHRIEHVQVIHPDDVDRFEKLGVVASMQPLHCPADRVNAERYWGERTQHAFAYRSLLDAGVTLAFGSDCPFGLDLSVDSFSILNGVHAAVTRKARDTDDPSWHPEQAATVHEALAAFTSGPAHVGGEDGWRGSLTPGKVADMVVLGEDLYGVEPDDIARVPIVATIVGGRLVYGGVG